jgi:iron complex outermembrane receptor protein
MKKIYLLTGLLYSFSLFAQPIETLQPVSVTATRSPQKINETGRSITVIDGNQFQQLPVASIDELLKFVPGVEVQSRGPMGAQSDIVIRGGTFQQVLVLLDGVKLNDPITGHFSSYIPIAPYEIDRIEILKGPAAAIYGAEAVGGVVHIISKTFSAFNKSKISTAKATVALGQYGLMNADAGFQKNMKKSTLIFGVLSNNTYGQLLRGKNRGYLHNHTFSGSVAFDLGKQWQLSIRSSYDNRRFAAQNFYTTFVSDTATEKVNTWWNQVQLKQQKANRTRQIDVLYKRTSDNYLFNPASIANENKSNHFVLQYIDALKINSQWNLSLGTQIDRRAIVSNDRGNHATHHGAIFGSLLFTKNKWRISPVLRADWDENYGGALLPQLNIAYLLPKITLRANAGKAIRSADYTERFNNYNKAIVRSGSIGNPDLTTENSWSYETGADFFIGTHFKLTVNGFYRDQKNVIDFVQTAYADMPRKENLVPNGVYALAKNIKSLQTRGIEVECTYQNRFSTQQSLMISAGSTFLKSTTSDAVPSFYILSHARTLIQTNIIYQLKKITIAVNSVYKERANRTAPAINANISKSYFIVHSKLAYQVQSGVQFFIACNNIGDIQYSDLLGSSMPRRWTSGGITLQFK